MHGAAGRYGTLLPSQECHTFLFISPSTLFHFFLLMYSQLQNMLHGFSDAYVKVNFSSRLSSISFSILNLLLNHFLRTMTFEIYFTKWKQIIGRFPIEIYLSLRVNKTFAALCYSIQNGNAKTWWHNLWKFQMCKFYMRIINTWHAWRSN